MFKIIFCLLCLQYFNISEFRKHKKIISLQRSNSTHSIREPIFKLCNTMQFTMRESKIEKASLKNISSNTKLTKQNAEKT